MTERQVRDFVVARGASLYRTAYLLVHDNDEAEDLVQSTLVQLITAWSRISRRDAPEVYARRVLVNLAIRRLRRRRTLREVMSKLGPLDPAPDHADMVASGTDVASALGSLPPRMRAVVVLRFYDDLSVAETADALGVTVGTVKSQTSKALVHLRNRMQLRNLVLEPPAIHSRSPAIRGVIP